MTLTHSTSQRFLLLGQVARKDQAKDTGCVFIIQLDFFGTRKRRCGAEDFEKWYARTSKTECLISHNVRFTHFTVCGFNQAVFW